MYLFWTYYFLKNEFIIIDISTLFCSESHWPTIQLATPATRVQPICLSNDRTLRSNLAVRVSPADIGRWFIGRWLHSDADVRQRASWLTGRLTERPSQLMTITGDATIINFMNILRLINKLIWKESENGGKFERNDLFVGFKLLKLNFVSHKFRRNSYQSIAL